MTIENRLSALEGKLDQVLAIVESLRPLEEIQLLSRQAEEAARLRGSGRKDGQGQVSPFGLL